MNDLIKIVPEEPDMPMENQTAPATESAPSRRGRPAGSKNKMRQADADKITSGLIGELASKASRNTAATEILVRTLRELADTFENLMSTN